MTSVKRDITPKRASDQELQRRWLGVRRAMKERNLDFLIFQGNFAHLPGYIKWFTDLSIKSSYISTVIFPREDEMTTIWHGARPPAEPRPPKNAVRGVKKRIAVPIIQNLSYSTCFDAEEVVEELSPFKNCRIGIVGKGIMSAAFYEYITANLSLAKFEDASDLVDKIKVIKSDEELELIKETCWLEKEIFDYSMKLIHPGRFDVDIQTEVTKFCLDVGAVEYNIMVSSGSAGAPPQPGPRILQKGDMFSLLIETDSPSGYWGELSRTFCLEKITPEVQEHFEAAREAQQKIVDILKPGISPKYLYETVNAFLKRNGFAEETRIFAHGQGYDIVENPCFVPEDAMKIDNNMFLAIHPSAASARARVGICDNYIIKAGKAERVLDIPQKIFVV